MSQMDFHLHGPGVSTVPSLEPQAFPRHDETLRQPTLPDADSLTTAPPASPEMQPLVILPTDDVTDAEGLVRTLGAAMSVQDQNKMAEQARRFAELGEDMRRQFARRMKEHQQKIAEMRAAMAAQQQELRNNALADAQRQMEAERRRMEAEARQQVQEMQLMAQRAQERMQQEQARVEQTLEKHAAEQAEKMQQAQQQKLGDVHQLDTIAFHMESGGGPEGAGSEGGGAGAGGAGVGGDIGGPTGGVESGGPNGFGDKGVHDGGAEHPDPVLVNRPASSANPDPTGQGVAAGPPPGVAPPTPVVTPVNGPSANGVPDPLAHRTDFLEMHDGDKRFFTHEYFGLPPEERAQIRAALHERGYTHLYAYVANEGDYGGNTKFNFYEKPDELRVMMKELVDDGIAPVLWLFPDDSDGLVNQYPPTKLAETWKDFIPKVDDLASSYVLGLESDEYWQPEDEKFLGSKLNEITDKPIFVHQTPGNWELAREPWSDGIIYQYGFGQSDAQIADRTRGLSDRMHALGKVFIAGEYEGDSEEHARHLGDVAMDNGADGYGNGGTIPAPDMVAAPPAAATAPPTNGNVPADQPSGDTPTLPTNAGGVTGPAPNQPAAVPRVQPMNAPGQIQEINVGGRPIFGGNTGGYYIIGSPTGGDEKPENPWSIGTPDGLHLVAPDGTADIPFRLLINGENPMHVRVEVGPLPKAMSTLSVPMDLSKQLFTQFAFSRGGIRVSDLRTESRSSGDYASLTPRWALSDGSKVGNATLTGVRPGDWLEASTADGLRVRRTIIDSNATTMIAFNHPGTNNLEIAWSRPDGKIPAGSVLFLEEQITFST